MGEFWFGLEWVGSSIACIGSLDRQATESMHASKRRRAQAPDTPEGREAQIGQKGLKASLVASALGDFDKAKGRKAFATRAYRECDTGVQMIVVRYTGFAFFQCHSHCGEVHSYAAETLLGKHFAHLNCVSVVRVSHLWHR